MTLVTWGDKHSGGGSISVKTTLMGVDNTYSTNNPFAAVLENATAVMWGHKDDSGDICGVTAVLKDMAVVTDKHSGGYTSSVRTTLMGVDEINLTNNAFAAVLKDTTVVTWGHKYPVGDPSRVTTALNRVDKIYSTDNAAFTLLCPQEAASCKDVEFKKELKQLKEAPLLTLMRATSDTKR